MCHYAELYWWDNTFSYSHLEQCFHACCSSRLWTQVNKNTWCVDEIFLAIVILHQQNPHEEYKILKSDWSLCTINIYFDLLSLLAQISHKEITLFSPLVPPCSVVTVSMFSVSLVLFVLHKVHESWAKAQRIWEPMKSRSSSMIG